MKNTNIILKKNNINSKLQSKNLANESINIMKSEINYLWKKILKRKLFKCKKDFKIINNEYLKTKKSKEIFKPS